MTGETAKSWSWLHSIAVPALLAVVEATWLSVSLSLVPLGPHRAADVSFLAVALPAVIAVIAAGLVHRGYRVSLRARSGFVRVAGRAGALAVITVAVLVGVALTAGLVAARVGPADWATVAFHPWHVHSPVALATMRLGWIIALTTWLGGFWLGSDEVGESRARAGVAVAAGALAIFLVVAAADHRSAPGHHAGTAAILLLVAFPAAVAVLALVHQRDLERILRRPNRSSGGSWLAVLIVPMAVVAGLAAVAGLVAVAFGLLAAAAVRAVHGELTWAGSLVADLGRWLGHFIHPGKAAPAPPPPPPPGPSLALVIAAVVGGAIAGGRGIVSWFRHRTGRTHRRKVRAPNTTSVPDGHVPTRTPADADQVETVFSWAHLLDQLRAFICRHLRRFNFSTGRQAENCVVDDPLPASGRQPDSVRAQYRRMLIAAKAGGHARQPRETPLELRLRLAQLDPGTPSFQLEELTRLYTMVRYGDQPDGTDFTRAASTHVDTLTAWLSDMARADRT